MQSEKNPSEKSGGGFIVKRIPAKNAQVPARTVEIESRMPELRPTAPSRGFRVRPRALPSRAVVPALALLIALLTGPGLPEGAGARAADRTDESTARPYLERAIVEYRGGVEERARFFLGVARGDDPEWTASRPETHKLEGFLLLSEGRNRQAAYALLESLRIEPEQPFLWYIIGHYNLHAGARLKAGRAYREAALREADLRRTGRGEPASEALPPGEADLLPVLNPLSCPPAGEDQRKAWTGAIVQPVWTDSFLYRRLWDRSLSDGELAAASLQALLLLGRVRTSTPEGAPDAESPGGPPTIEARTAAAGGATTRQMILGLEETLAEARELPRARRELSDPTVALLTEPTRDRWFRTCLRNLELAEQDLIARDREGLSDPARADLSELRRRTNELYRQRMEWFDDASGAFAYGKRLLHLEKHLLALHALRRSLQRSYAERTAPDAAPPPALPWDDRPAIARLQQTFQALRDAYAGLGRSVDAQTCEALAAELATFLSEPDDAAARAERERLIFHRAGENLKHREALLLLIARSRASGDGRLEFYRRKLAERDAEYDERELLSAFDYARN